MTRYFTYIEPDENMEPVTITVSEDELKEGYYKYWYERMTSKYGRVVVERDYTFEDCLDDFKAVNLAWESDKNGNKHDR